MGLNPMTPEASAALARFRWPELGGVRPVWQGADFIVGAERRRVLAYHESESGWSAALTDLHAEHANDHPIQLASWRLAAGLLRARLAKGAVVLEVGTNTGGFIKALGEPGFAVIGSDYLSHSLNIAAGRLPGVPLIQFDLTQCPLEDGSVDGVVLLNVLEHIENDTAALRQLHRILKPGGVMVLEVPAGPALFDYYDEHVGHFRRYAKAPLLALVERAGFSIAYATHLGVVLYPPFALLKLFNRVFKRRLAPAERDRLVAREMASTARPWLGAVLAAEQRLGRRVRYPFGIRCVVAAVK